MAKYINVAKQLVRLYRLNLDCEDVIKEFLVTAEPEEVVEVVRCKDCIYWEQDVIFQDGWCRGKHQGNPYWFCADGKRKEDV